jgi:hypothetical protein
MSDLASGGSIAVPETPPAVCMCPACLSPFISTNHRPEPIDEPSSFEFVEEQLLAWGFAC